MPIEDESPRCILIALCDQVIDDKATNNKSLIGMFSSILVEDLESTAISMWVFATITNFVGTLPVTLLITDPDGAEIARGDVEIQSKALSVYNEIGAHILGMVINKLGVYLASIVARDKTIASRYFVVTMPE